MNDTSVAQQNKVQDHASKKKVYVETWFIVPRCILDLPGLTFSYLKAYEIIYQFWNKGRDCFVGQKSFMERANISEKQLYRALDFLEKNGEIDRQLIDGKRYIVRPQARIQTDIKLSADDKQGAVIHDSTHCHTGQSRAVIHDSHNIKKGNKELNKEKINKKEKSALQECAGAKMAVPSQESICTKEIEAPALELMPPLNEIAVNTHERETKQMIPYQETLYPMPALKETASNGGLAVDKLTEINPHNIPVQMIRDWLQVRRAKRSPVTATAWARLTNQLGKCEDPVEAFEIMVTQGWASFNHAWLANIKGIGSAKKTKVDVCEELESDDWINRV